MGKINEVEKKKVNNQKTCDNIKKLIFSELNFMEKNKTIEKGSHSHAMVQWKIIFTVTITTAATILPIHITCLIIM